MRRSRSVPARYKGTAYAIEGDWSSASYLFALAAALGGRVTVRNLDPASAQGDRRFVGALAAMGCRVSSGPDGVTVERDGPLRGIDCEMSSAPDTVQTLAVIAALAEGPTRITGVGHLRHKESDRLAVTADRLRALGAGATVEEDAIVVTPGPLHGGSIDPAGDHRTAMAFAVLGLAVGDVADRGSGLCREVLARVLVCAPGGRAAVKVVLTGYRGTGKTTVGRLARDSSRSPVPSTRTRWSRPGPAGRSRPSSPPKARRASAPSSGRSVPGLPARRA